MRTITIGADAHRTQMTLNGSAGDPARGVEVKLVKNRRGTERLRLDFVTVTGAIVGFKEDRTGTHRLKGVQLGAGMNFQTKTIPMRKLEWQDDQMDELVTLALSQIN